MNPKRERQSMPAPAAPKNPTREKATPPTPQRQPTNPPREKKAGALRVRILRGSLPKGMTITRDPVTGNEQIEGTPQHGGNFAIEIFSPLALVALLLLGGCTHAHVTRMPVDVIVDHEPYCSNKIVRTDGEIVIDKPTRGRCH